MLAGQSTGIVRTAGRVVLGEVLRVVLRKLRHSRFDDCQATRFAHRLRAKVGVGA